MTPRLEDFEGEWVLERSIADRKGGADGRFRGRASFAPDGAVLHYRESGTLEMGETAFEARQSHLWRLDGSHFRVCFADGRPFHDFEVGIDRPDARHDCPPDLYLVRYDFSAWPQWTAEWAVTGPRKDHLITSRYVRA